MPLREHLRELRRRLVVSVAAIGLGSVGGWFLYEPFYNALTEPLYRMAKADGRTVAITFTELTGAFNLRIQLSLVLGLLVSSPIWLYQIWGFIVPGLTRREKRYAFGYLGAAVPLFLGGVFFAWQVLPNAAAFLIEFSPENASNFFTATHYIDFVTRLALAFGAAFVVPVVLVALNMVGLVSARALLGAWRIAVFLCFLFSAVASPTPDAITMIVLALPIVALYFIAVGVAFLHDRRVAARRSEDGFGDLDDDAASPLGPDGFDDSVAEIDSSGAPQPEAVERPAPLDAGGLL